MPRVYVSIGSNIDRDQNIRGAVDALTRHYGDIRASRTVESAAEGFEGDDFYNLVATFETTEPLEAVRARLAAIEIAHGRTRGGPRFSARTLDLDILLYGNLIQHDGRIDIPRDEIHRYAFVLGPLAELAPDERHPETGETFGALWTAFCRAQPDQCRLRTIEARP